MKFALMLACGIILNAQTPESGLGIGPVVVPLTVTDAKGRSLDDLKESGFELYDNGVRQRIVVESPATGVSPIALVIAVQSAGISAPALEKVKRIGAMIQPLVTGERGCAALVSFDHKVRWHQECTKSSDALARAFHSLDTGGQRKARMLDAVDEAIQHLSKRTKMRRVVLLISESRDRGSESDLESVGIAAQAAGVTVYSCTYSAFATAWTTLTAKLEPAPQLPVPGPDHKTMPMPKTRYSLPAPDQRVDLLAGIAELARLGKVKDSDVLTSVTGGTTFQFTRQKGLEDAIAKLGSELQGQYVLSFTPVNPAAGYHRLDVRVSGPDKVLVRARPGYWTPEN